MTRSARQPAQRAPDPALLDLIRALARDAARRDDQAERMKARKSEPQP